MQAELEKRETAVVEADKARQALASDLQDARAELAEARGCAAEAERDRDRAREQHADAQKQVAYAGRMLMELIMMCGFWETCACVWCVNHAGMLMRVTTSNLM